MAKKKAYALRDGKLVKVEVDDEPVVLDPEGTSFGLTFVDGMVTMEGIDPKPSEEQRKAAVELLKKVNRKAKKK